MLGFLQMARTTEKKQKAKQFIMSLAVDEDFSSRLDRFVEEMTRMGVKHSSTYRKTLNRTEALKICFDYVSEATAQADFAQWAKTRAGRKRRQFFEERREQMMLKSLRR